MTAPDGTETEVVLEETAPGRFTAEIEGAEQGLYRLREAKRETVIALGPAAPREFEEDHRQRRCGLSRWPILCRGRFGWRLEDGMPDLRRVAEGRVGQNGRGWIGLTTRDAYLTTDGGVTVTPLISAWLFLLLAGALDRRGLAARGTPLRTSDEELAVAGRAARGLAAVAPFRSGRSAVAVSIGPRASASGAARRSGRGQRRGHCIGDSGGTGWSAFDLRAARGIMAIIHRTTPVVCEAAHRCPRESRRIEGGGWRF